MLARAMIRDLYTRTQAAQILSTLTIIMAIAGPLLGGQILKLSTWHDIFWLLAVIGSLMFISLFFLPETHTDNRRQKNSVKVVFQHYGRLLNHWPFIRYILSVTFFYGAAYTFIVGSPSVYITYYGVDPQHYGWLFAINIVGIMALSFINRTLVSRFSLDSLLRCATAFSAMALVILCALFYLGIGGIYSVVIMVFFFFSMNGTVAANSTATGTPAIMIVIMTFFTVLSAVMILIPSKKSESEN